MSARTLHTILAAAWFIAAWPIMFTSLNHSLPLLMFLSVYAIVAGHWAGREGSTTDRERE